MNNNILILSAYTDCIPWNNYGKNDYFHLSLEQNKKYAKKNNYDFKYIEYKIEKINKYYTPTWIKIDAIIRNIKNYDYICWIDADAVFLKNIKLEYFFEKDITITKCLNVENYSHTLTTTNTGFVLIKNTDFSINVFKNLIQQSNKWREGQYKKGYWHEQGLLDEMYIRPQIINTYKFNEDYYNLINNSTKDLSEIFNTKNFQILPYKFQTDDINNIHYIYHAAGDTPTKKERIQESIKKNNEIIYNNNSINSFIESFNKKRNNKKCYVLFCDEEYYTYVKNVLILLDKFSKYNVLVYTINFSPSDHFENVIWRRINDDNLLEYQNYNKNHLIKNNYNKIIYTCINKIKAINMSLKENFDEFVYLDSDTFPNKNIDDIFKTAKKGLEYPILPEYEHGIMMYGDKGNPWTENGYDETKTLEWWLINKLNLINKYERYYYRQSCFFYYNKKTKPFWDEALKIISDEEIFKNQDNFFGDESIINVLLWKNKAKEHFNKKFILNFDRSIIKTFKDVDVFFEKKDLHIYWLLHGKVYRFIFKEIADTYQYNEDKNREINNYFINKIINNEKEKINNDIKENSLINTKQIKEKQDTIFRNKTLMNNKNYKSSEEIFVIGTYPDNKFKEDILKDRIKQIKKLGFKICIVSHYPISLEIQNSVEFCICDKENNILSKDEDHPIVSYWYEVPNYFKIIAPFKDGKYQPVDILHSLKNACSILKDNYKIIHYIESDTVIDIKKYLNICKKIQKKAYFIPYDTTKGFNTNIFSFDIKWMDNIIPRFFSYKEYVQFGKEIAKKLSVQYDEPFEIWMKRLILYKDSKENIFICTNKEKSEIIKKSNVIQTENLYNIRFHVGETINNKNVLFIINDGDESVNIKINYENLEYYNDLLSSKCFTYVTFKEKIHNKIIAYLNETKRYITIDQKDIEQTKFKFADDRLISKNWENKIYDKKEKNKVLISFKSKSLGDTIAWMPYVEEYRRIHNCDMVLSTFWNNLFKKEYPEIEFVEPGSVIHNLQKIYNIGWFLPWDPNKNPNNYKTIPLQQTASDILGLNFKEIKPKITIPKGDREIPEKYVCISIHSTCQTKYWNYPNGWQEITDYLLQNGYKVVMISKEEDGYMGNYYPKGIIDKHGLGIEETMNILKYSEMHITISSGLSWISWAMDIPTIIISGFTGPDFEPKQGIERIFNPDVCNSCFNDPNLDFDKGDWNWCPRKKDFECSKKITPDMVTESINKIRRKT